jgi:hypothetical protein
MSRPLKTWHSAPGSRKPVSGTGLPGVERVPRDLRRPSNSPGA